MATKEIILVNRIEVIDHTKDGEGRVYTKWAKTPFVVEGEFQDKNRTLKVFLSDRPIKSKRTRK